MISSEEVKVYDVLKELDIPYKRFEHIPIYTIEEAKKLDSEIAGKHCKNLFLRNRKGNKYYLVVMVDYKSADLKALSEEIGENSLSFASEDRLYNCLGLKKGAVTPLGIINDIKKEVIVLIDRDLEGSESICVHPNVNTATVTIGYSGFIKFLDWSGNHYLYVKV